MSEIGRIYVLHFDPPLFHAKHYIGFAEGESALRRVQEHLSLKAHSSPLVKAVIAGGGSVALALEIAGTRDEERALKLQKNARAICPLCKPGYLADAAGRMRRMRQERKRGLETA